MINILKKIITERRWFDLIYFARCRILEDGWRYMQRYGKGVEAVKLAFYKIYGRQAYPEASLKNKLYDEQIAYVLRELGGKPGVAALISDMRKAKQYKPRSILFFLYRQDGQASRWENLLVDFKHRKALQEKTELAAKSDQLAKQLPGVDKIGGEPDWVRDVRQRWEYLYKTRHALEGQKYLKAYREMERIEQALNKHGYKVRGKL